MRTHRRLVALLATLALAAAACGGGGDDEVSTRGTSSSSSSSTTTTTSGDGEGDGGTGAGSSTGESGATPTDGGSTSGSGSSGGSGGDAGAPPSDSSAAQPVAAGAYRYDTSGSADGPSGSEDFAGVTTLEVKRPDGARQRSIRDLRDDSGEGTVTTLDVLYRDDGVYLEYLKIVNSSGFGTFTFEFEFDPPQLVSPTNPEPGFHTEFSARSTDGSIDADITMDITGRETLTIGGVSVATLTTETVIVFSGSFDGESTWHDNVDPERFLIVREDRTSDVEVGVSKFHTEYVATLRSLSPQ